MQASWAKEGPGKHHLFNITQIVKDLEELGIDHRHVIGCLDTTVDNIASGLNRIVHLVRVDRH